MNQAIATKLTEARTMLLLNHGFFGQLALRLQFVEDPSRPTLAVDGRKIFYNPDFVDSLDMDVTQSAIAHEVMHCVLDHIVRRGNRNPRRWNRACDYALNPIIEEAGLRLGEGWLNSPIFAGKSADEIYTMLPEDENGDDALDEIEPATESDADIITMEWKMAAVQAAQQARARGKLPAGLERFVSQITTPQVDWRAQLRRFVTERTRDDYSWMRPNRKFIASGLYMPSLYSESMGSIVWAIDTSGSISQDTLNTFGTEVSAIWDNVRPANGLGIYCDAEINHIDEFSPGDPLHFKLHGGGGTDFRPPFEEVERRNERPAALIYLTDGYGPFPETPPPYPVLWVMTTDEVAPFGETVRIEA